MLVRPGLIKCGKTMRFRAQTTVTEATQTSVRRSASPARIEQMVRLYNPPTSTKCACALPCTTSTSSDGLWGVHSRRWMSQRNAANRSGQRRERNSPRNGKMTGTAALSLQKSGLSAGRQRVWIRQPMTIHTVVSEGKEPLSSDEIDAGATKRCVRGRYLTLGSKRRR